MRGPDNTVNPVRGESAQSCNTFDSLHFKGFPPLSHMAKAKAARATLTAKNG